MSATTKLPRILLATAGSLGDLHPFIALAQALRDLGVQAEIATSPEYADKVRVEGFVFHTIGPGLAELQTRMGLDAGELTRRVAASNAFLFEKIVLPHLEDGTRALIAVAEGASAIVGTTFAASAAIASETLGIPFVPVALQPAIVFSAYDPPTLPAAPWLAPASGGLRLLLNRATVAMARTSTSRWTRPVDRIRERLGLPSEKRNLLLDGLSGRSLSLGLYSPLLSPKQPDAPEGFKVVGYASYDSDAGGASTLPLELAAFLAAGPPPVVFTLGSAAVNIADDFYIESLKAARLLGVRAVLLVGPDGELDVADGADAIAIRYAPFSQLFPHAAAIVHQGGVGTTQQALRAGRPQLVVPHLGDQFDNAARIVRLGCGATLSRRRYTSDRIVPALGQVLSDFSVAERSIHLGRRASSEDGAAVAANLLARLTGQRAPK